MTVESIKASSMTQAMLKAKKIFEDDAVILESKNLILDGKNYYELLVSGTIKVANGKNENRKIKNNIQQIREISNKFKPSQEIVNSQKNIPFPNNENFKILLEDEYEIITSLNKEKLKTYKSLKQKGISCDIAYSIIEELYEFGFENEIEKNFIIEKMIRDNLQVSGNLYNKTNDQRIISLIGTTGVGKTTTLAKIVSEALISYNKKVVLFTFDNYKKSTLLQLKVHASILKVPFEIIKSKKDFENKLAKYNNFDMILLDTEGVDVFKKEQLLKLNDLLNIPQRIEKHLTIPVTLREYDQINVFKKFKSFNPDYLLFTRLDETDQYSSILNLNLKTDIPISYLTTGPHITGDMLLANESKIARLIMN